MLLEHRLHVGCKTVEAAPQVHRRHGYEYPRRWGQGNEHGRRKESISAIAQATSVSRARRTVVPLGNPTSAVHDVGVTTADGNRTSWNIGTPAWALRGVRDAYTQ